MPSAYRVDLVGEEERITEEAHVSLRLRRRTRERESRARTALQDSHGSLSEAALLRREKQALLSQSDRLKAHFQVLQVSALAADITARHLELKREVARERDRKLSAHAVAAVGRPAPSQ